MIMKLWKRIDKKNITEVAKYKLILFILSLIYGAIGLLAWLAVRLIALKTLDWLVCFIGYPVVLSWGVVLYYSFTHNFHDGKYDTDTN